MFSLPAFLLAALPAGDAVLRIELYASDQLRVSRSQEWARKFAEEDVRVTIGVERPGVDYGVFEKVRGPLRFVTVRAPLTDKGHIKLPDKTLRLSDGDAFHKWLDGLRVYGAAGDPIGQSGWGLSPVDWAALCRDAARKAPVSNSTTVGGVLTRLETATGREVLPDETVDRTAECQAPPADVSVGVGTAIALRSAGLALSPRRTPDGDVVWSVTPLADNGAAWPTGWMMTPDADRGAALAALYVQGELPTAATLGDFVEAIEAVTGVSHVPLETDLAEWRDGWRRVDTRLQPRKGRPILVLNRVLRKNRLTTRLVWDDAGRAFVLIRPSDGKPDPKPRELRPPAVATVDPVAAE